MAHKTFDFTDQVVVITGAAGNLGEAVVNAFHEAGAKLTLIDHSPDRLQKMFPALAASDNCFLAQSVDVTSMEAMEAVAAETVSRFGRVDVLVNTVGGYKAGPQLHETPLETWNFMMDLNAKSVFVAGHAFISYMLRQGKAKIVSVASRAALSGDAGAAAYSASKAAVVRLTESMAAELNDDGINVNCVLPGIIDTPSNRQAMPDADHSKWIQPAEIANVILFLSSDLACAINGAAIPVYGRS